MRARLFLFTTLALVGCPSKDAPGPGPSTAGLTPAPATALAACKALIEAAKLERMSCAPMTAKAVAAQGEHLKEGACLGSSDQDCRAFVLLYDSVEAHEKVEKLEADAAVRVVQNAKAAVTVRILDASLDASLGALQARVSSWAR
jgi:hypothetical protein